MNALLGSSRGAILPVGDLAVDNSRKLVVSKVSKPAGDVGHTDDEAEQLVISILEVSCARPRVQGMAYGLLVARHLG